MKKLIVLLLVMLAQPAFSQPAPRRDYDSSKLSTLGQQIEKMNFPPLNWHVPRVGQEITRTVLPNGLVLYLYPDHSVPAAHVSYVVHGGRLYETPAEDQTSNLLGSFLRMGGTQALTYEQLTEELEGQATNLYAWVGDETGDINATCLAAQLPRVIELYSDLLLRPGFREDKLDLIKKNEKESILRQKDYPSWMIGTLFDAQLYGDHPYGRIPRLPRIEAVTKDELVQCYKRLIVPDRSFLAISGDFDPAKTSALVASQFADWKKASEKLPPVQKVNENFKPGFYHFEKDIPQTNIRMGHFGVKRGNPDECALMVMNSILGGEAFKSRIMRRVRSDEGLAYSAGSRFGTGTLEPSAFTCHSETKNEKAFRTVTIIKETMAEMTQYPPSAEELKQAKETIINSFIHRWTDTSYSLNQIMELEVDGLPGDYYEKYAGRIEAVTANEVMRVAKQYLHPDRLIVVLVGKRADMTDLPKDLRLTEVTLPPEYLE
jgi:zinc protease